MQRLNPPDSMEIQAVRRWQCGMEIVDQKGFVVRVDEVSGTSMRVRLAKISKDHVNPDSSEIHVLDDDIMKG